MFAKGMPIKQMSRKLRVREDVLKRWKKTLAPSKEAAKDK